MYTVKSGNKHITMDHIFNGTFSPKWVSHSWVKEGEWVYCRGADGSRGRNIL